MAGRIGSVYFLDKPLDSELPNRDVFFYPLDFILLGRVVISDFFMPTLFWAWTIFFLWQKSPPAWVRIEAHYENLHPIRRTSFILHIYD